MVDMAAVPNTDDSWGREARHVSTRFGNMETIMALMDCSAESKDNSRTVWGKERGQRGPGKVCGTSWCHSAFSCYNRYSPLWSGNDDTMLCGLWRGLCKSLKASRENRLWKSDLPALRAEGRGQHKYAVDMYSHNIVPGTEHVLHQYSPNSIGLQCPPP